MAQKEAKVQSDSRREFLKTSGLCCATMLAGIIGPGFAGRVVADTGAKSASPPLPPQIDNIKQVLRKNFGDRKINMSHVDLKVPIIAENGAVVPIKIITDLPMQPDNYVRKLYLFVDENTNPYIASATLTPENGSAGLQLKIKMRKTSNVRAVAVMSDGTLYGDIKSVKVTLGGCGG
jgi:sulfur-oxidizing protein SoxY